MESSSRPMIEAEQLGLTLTELVSRRARLSLIHIYCSFLVSRDVCMGHGASAFASDEWCLSGLGRKGSASGN
jgi:hypothetical protein